jgi:hypothetical protein
VLSRSTYEPFKVSSDHQGPIEFKAQAKTAMDLVIRKHTYAAGGTTGWHQHPGPVFITVTKGTVTFYERDDPSCTPHVVSADKSVSPTNTYVDDGDGHVGRNETGEPAEDISIITAPVGGPFRTNLPQEGSSCSF